MGNVPTAREITDIVGYRLLTLDRGAYDVTWLPFGKSGVWRVKKGNDLLGEITIGESAPDGGSARPWLSMSPLDGGEWDSIRAGVEADVNRLANAEIDHVEKRTPRGANDGTLEACEQALENWLDKDILFTQAAKTVTPKTVRVRTPDVLRRVRAKDPTKCARWVSEIKARGKSKYLGDFR